MKIINKFNQIQIGITAILVFFLIYKVTVYKASERFYYITGVSNPKEFPIKLSGIWFYIPNGNYASASFYNTKNRVNNFYSDWGRDEYENAHEPEFLPESLFLEYIDFRTENYYMDTIPLPKEKMTDIFNEVTKSGHLKNLSAWDPRMGLKFHVGIANEGNIIFWLIGDKWEKEFYRTQLKPKPFPKKMVVFPNGAEIHDKREYIDNLFEKIPDSIKTQLKKSKINAQYKDSIPIYFDNYQK